MSDDIIFPEFTSDGNQLSEFASRHLFDVLSKQYPDADNFELQRIGNDIIENLSIRMEQGYQPAVAKPNFDGSMDLIVLTVERLLKGGE